MSKEALELAVGPLRLALRPDLGGSIAGLWSEGLPVLRSTEPALLERVRQAACFPLVPYSNRLGFRRFRWQGREYTTQPNYDDSPHSLHGVAWQRPWEVAAASGSRAELLLRHGADEHWPFEFEVRQRFLLGTRSLEAELVLNNTAAVAQPVGLGWHPYFPRRSRSRLHLEVAQRWESDSTQLPTRRVAQPGIDGDVAPLRFDHCFEGWQGSARIRDEAFSLRLTSSLPYVVVYTPAEKNYFCVEPVSHVNNAIHMTDPAAHGLVALAPGDVLKAWMKLEISNA
jgi:aldose 1-epimerase